MFVGEMCLNCNFLIYAICIFWEENINNGNTTLELKMRINGAMLDQMFVVDMYL